MDYLLVVLFEGSLNHLTSARQKYNRLLSDKSQELFYLRIFAHAIADYRIFVNHCGAIPPAMQHADPQTGAGWRLTSCPLMATQSIKARTDAAGGRKTGIEGASFGNAAERRRIH